MDFFGSFLGYILMVDTVKAVPLNPLLSPLIGEWVCVDMAREVAIKARIEDADLRQAGEDFLGDLDPF